MPGLFRRPEPRGRDAAGATHDPAPGASRRMPTRASAHPVWLAAVLAFALSAVAPRDAQAQPTGLKAVPGDGRVTLTWDNPNNPRIAGWAYRQFPASFSQELGFSRNANTTSLTITRLTNWQSYRIGILYYFVNPYRLSHTAWITVTPMPPPTLVSAPDGRAVAGALSGTARVCFNLLAVTHGSTTYLEARDSRIPIAAAPELLDGTSGVEIASAPAGISTGRGVDLSPCADLGVGAHTVAWSWRGGRTSTTITITDIPLPARPRNVTATAGQASVTLNWVDPRNPTISHWEVQQKRGSGGYGSWIPVPGSRANTTSYTVDKLRDNTNYGFRVRAVNRLGGGPASDEATARPLQKPGTWLIATPGDGRADLYWSTHWGGAANWSYRYKQASNTDYGRWTPVPGANSLTRTATISGLTNGASYNFQVRFTSTGFVVRSEMSNAADVTLRGGDAPARPAGLTATTGAGRVTLTWDAQPGQSIAQWAYQIKAGSAAWGRTSTVFAGTGSTTIRIIPWLAAGLAAGRDYAFRIQARTATGAASPWSDEATASIPSAAAGVVVTGSPLVIAEGRTGTYTVKLTTAPASTATVTPFSGDEDKVGVSGPLTFTAGNYGTAQTVTVTAKQDADMDNEEVAITHTVAGYAGVAVDGVTVKVEDDERAVALTSDQPNNRIVEGDAGTKDVVLTVTLRAPAPSGGLVFAIGQPAGATATASSRSANSCGTPLTPADTDWCSASGGATVAVAGGRRTGTKTIRILGDTRDELNETIRFSADLTGWTSNVLTLTIKDDDGPGVIISKERLTVAEGGTGTYTVKLNTAPAGTATVTPSSDDLGAVTFSPASLEFTGSDFGTPQEVTVTGAQDADRDDEEAKITHAVTGYAGAGPVDAVTVTVEDDEGAITLSSDQLDDSVAEGDSGTTDVVITATLSKPAPADFSLTVSGAAGSTATASSRTANSCAAPLKPSDADWCLPDGFAVAIAEGETKGTQTIRIVGDRRDEPDETIVLSADALNWVSGALTLTVADDDEPGVTVSPGTLTVAEGAEKTYAVKLNSQPAGTVTVTPSSSDTGAATFSPASLEFTPANFGREQRVTVTAKPDADRDDEEVAISHAVAGYAGVSTAASVTVTVEDTEGTITLTSDHPGNSVAEGDSGAKDVMITATLSKPAPADFSLHVAAGAGSTAQLSRRRANSCGTPPTPADTDWCLPNGPIVTISEGETRGTQTIRIVGDNRDEPDETIVLAGDALNWVSGALTLTLTDDDASDMTVSPGTLTVAEGGTGTYTVKLNVEPAGSVIVTPSSRDTDAVTVSPASLVFTRGNYRTAQTVTVTGIQDRDGNNESVTIRHVTTGGGYGPGTQGPVTVNVTDDDIIATADAAGSSAERISVSWTYNGPFPSGAVWQWQTVAPGVDIYKQQPNFKDFVGSSARLRATSLPGISGNRFYARIRLRDVNNNVIATSNFASATISGTAQPTLVSDPDRTVRVGPDGTARVCFNLLAALHGNATYLESREGRTPVSAHSVLKDGTNGVAITEAPSGISVGTGSVDLNPCATLGPGVHKVTWSWNGPVGKAIRAGRTSTTVTVLPADFPAKPTGLTATGRQRPGRPRLDQPRRRQHRPLGSAEEGGHWELRRLDARRFRRRHHQPHGHRPDQRRRLRLQDPGLERQRRGPALQPGHRHAGAADNGARRERFGAGDHVAGGQQRYLDGGVADATRGHRHRDAGQQRSRRRVVLSGQPGLHAQRLRPPDADGDGRAGFGREQRERYDQPRGQRLRRRDRRRLR